MAEASGFAMSTTLAIVVLLLVTTFTAWRETMKMIEVPFAQATQERRKEGRSGLIM